MDRRTALKALTVGPLLAGGGFLTGVARQEGGPLSPAGDTINVACLISDGAVVIDFCGPWEVFQDVAVGGPHTSPVHRMPFRMYTVAERPDPVRLSGGMSVLPTHTLDDAPAPHVVVVPAQGGRSDRMREWIRAAHDTADITMSVCTGAFLLASTGLLDGKTATTHHDYYGQFAETFPKVTLQRGVRFVEHDKVMTAGGLSSGIDGALRIVERYYGRDVASYAAEYMEYTGTAWQV